VLLPKKLITNNVLGLFLTFQLGMISRTLMNKMLCEKHKTMHTREINESELRQLLDLYQHLHEQDDKLPELEVIERVWQQIQNDSNIKYFGIFHNNKLVSSCTISVIPNLTRSCRPYAVIENVVTHKQYRKRGLGKTVLDKAISFGWENNCYKIMLMTGRLNENTFRFYESVGFKKDSKQAFILKRQNT